MNRKERILLLILASINFTHILDFMIIMPLGNYLMPYFHISTQQFSLIVSAYSYAAFASGIIAAFVIDNFDRKKSLLFGYTGFIIGTFLCGIAPDYKFLIGARIIAGLFGGLIGAQVLSIVADTFAYEKRGRAMGILMAAFSVASVLGIPISLYIANFFTWHAPFIMVAVIGVVLIPLCLKFIPPMTSHLNSREKLKPATGFLIVFSRKSSLVALGLTAVMVFGHFIVVPFINPFMEFNVGFTKEQIPLTYVVGGRRHLIFRTILRQAFRQKRKTADFYGLLDSDAPLRLFYYQHAAHLLLLCACHHRALVRRGQRPHDRGTGDGQQCDGTSVPRQLHERQLLAAAIVRGQRFLYGRTDCDQRPRDQKNRALRMGRLRQHRPAFLLHLPRVCIEAEYFRAMIGANDSNDSNGSIWW